VNSLNLPRLGVSVPKACGNAVVRNRIKRVIRESFRVNQHLISQSMDYLVIAAKPVKSQGKRSGIKLKNPLLTTKFDEIEREFMKLAVSGAEKALRSN